MPFAFYRDDPGGLGHCRQFFNVTICFSAIYKKDPPGWAESSFFLHI